MADTLPRGPFNASYVQAFGRSFTRPPRIQLQGVGSTEAKPAGALKVGDRVAWNYSRGYDYEVVSVTRNPSGLTMTVVERQLSTGREFTRKMSTTRLVASRDAIAFFNSSRTAPAGRSLRGT